MRARVPPPGAGPVGPSTARWPRRAKTASAWDANVGACKAQVTSGLSSPDATLLSGARHDRPGPDLRRVLLDRGAARNGPPSAPPTRRDERTGARDRRWHRPQPRLLSRVPGPAGADRARSRD